MSNKYDTTLYVGVTNDLERRVIEHRTPDPKSFTSRYNCHKLVYYEATTSRYGAITREKQIKSWSRKKKNELVESMNPKWEELYDKLF